MLLPLAHMQEKRRRWRRYGMEAAALEVSTLAWRGTCLCFIFCLWLYPWTNLTPGLLSHHTWGCQGSLFNIWICLLHSGCTGLCTTALAGDDASCAGVTLGLEKEWSSFLLPDFLSWSVFAFSFLSVQLVIMRCG